MAPYQRRRYKYRPFRQWRWRRFPYRRRRFTKAFRRRNKRYRTVRRKPFFKKYKKLKKLTLKQWQPNSIKKCRIKGFLPLFEGGDGRQEQNYALYKDSYVPEHEPGGGGWSIQRLSLGILYKENNILQNYWTKSNYRLNMCRFIGLKIIAYRQPYTSYVLHYFFDAPVNVTKYYYASFHPYKMLQLHHKIVVPSFNDQPHKKKPYKILRVPPPKPFQNKWFFQQHLSSFPLVHLASSAISLYNMYGSDRAQNNNCTIHTLNTVFFAHSCFQFRQQHTWGYTPNGNNYLYGIQHPEIPYENNKRNAAIYLGNTQLNEEGRPAGATTKTSQSFWGNPFHWTYLNGEAPTFITNATEDPERYLASAQLTSNIQKTLFRKTDSYITMRYNPFKDLGKGNRIYMIPTYDYSHNNWEPTADKDLMLEDFPLWIMLWGFENILKKMGKCPNIDYDWVLVINCKYLSATEPYIVLLSDYFVNGQGPYDAEREHIKPNDYSHWYPCFRYQREAIHAIIQTGPAVYRADHVKNMQAIIKYQFLFKWGGNPSPMENVYDPNSQPITPTPSGQQLQNEIIDPATNIQTFIYPWDCRRDYLTQSAADRINQSSIYETSLLTDGTTTATDVPLFQTETQAEKTPQTQEEALQFQLNKLQQFNQLLQLKFQRLASLLKDQ
nr:MAG: ORF1 [TTV-like mini virus]